MPSKRAEKKTRRSRSTSSSASKRKKSTKKQASRKDSADGKRRRRSSSSRRSESSSSRPRKLRPKKRSKSSGKPNPGRSKPDPSKAERKPFQDSAFGNGKEPPKILPAALAAATRIPHAKAKGAAGPKNGAAASPGITLPITQSGSPPVTPGSSPPVTLTNGGVVSSKLDLGNLADLQAKLEEDRNRLELFVIKAKREHEEKRATKEKHDAREREYYKAELGMPCGPDNRFLLEDELGKGVFSTVYSAKDMGHKGKEFAIKFIRADPMCRRATEKEIKLMRRLRNQASVSDPEGVQRLLMLAGVEMFEHEGHLAVVLQLMKCDLRCALRKYGQGHGLPLPFVHLFAKDIFLALRALRSIKVVHSDLKPDNLLMSLDRTSVRLSDFGSALDVAQAGQVRTDYLQPRFYRAPEVIMGQPYTTQIDMWSAGATLYELATDRTLFRGETNNGMIHAMLKVCGPFSKTLATSGKFASKHFSETGDFKLADKGNSSVETVVMSTFASPSPSVQQLIEEGAAKRAAMEGGSESKAKASMRHLADLVSKCCLLDPSERMSPKVALSHVFLQKADKAETAKAPN